MKSYTYGVITVANVCWLNSVAVAKDGDRWVCSFADVDKTSGTPVNEAVIYKFEVDRGFITEPDQDGFIIKFQIIRDDDDNLVGLNLGADSSGDNVEVLIIRKKALTFHNDWVDSPHDLRNPISGSCVRD